MKDQELLELCNKYLYCNPTDGILYRIKGGYGISKLGIVQCKGREGYGYLRVTLKGKKYLQHRIIFLMYHGYLPKFIDHISGVRDDNRIGNLREATKKQNNCNVKLRKDNKSGYKGVNWHKNNKSWLSSIRVNGKSSHIGYYSCKHEAAKAYNDAAIKQHGEFAFLNKLGGQL